MAHLKETLSFGDHGVRIVFSYKVDVDLDGLCRALKEIALSPILADAFYGRVSIGIAFGL